MILADDLDPLVHALRVLCERNDVNLIVTTCGTGLGAGASCTVTLAFKPTATGTRVALLSATDAASNSPQTVTLSGTGNPNTAKTPSITVNFG